MSDVKFSIGDFGWIWKTILILLIFMPTCGGCGACGESVIVRGCDVAVDGLHTITSTVSRFNEGDQR